MVRRTGLLKSIVATGAVCAALTTYLIAGPRDNPRQSGANSGSRFGSGNNSGALDNQSSQSTDSSSNPSFDRQRSRDRDSSEFGRDRAADGGEDGTDTSESGQSTAAAQANGSERRDSGSSFIHRANDEQAVETHDAKGKEGASETSEHRSEKSEVSKKFESSLLLADVARAPSATAGSPNRSGPTNNPGLDHMSQQGLQNSEAGRTTAQNAIDNHHNPLRQRERLNELERERVREFLRHQLTEQQRERLKGILEDGLTPTEREELRDFFKERVTPKQWELLKGFL